MTFMYIVIALMTLIAVIMILRAFGVFEATHEPSKVVQDIKSTRKLRRKRDFEKKKLGLYSGITETFRGVLMSENSYNNHMYWIQRLEKRSKILNRFYTPEEYRGKYALRLLVGLLCIPLGFLPIGILSYGFWIVTAYTVVTFVSYPIGLKQRIEDEDLIIDKNFLNLYLLLYSRLRMGARARLQPVVESYIETMDNESDTEVKNVMLKFSRYLLNNLSQYEDHVAVPKLRERYKGATIINFCNVAGQALQGVDNADNLLTFKMQLVERKTDEMRKRSEKIYKSGLRSIYLICIILFFFIAVGWWSKLPFDML